MPACAAYGCTERGLTAGVTLHRFPLKPELRKLWIKAVHRAHFIPSKSAVLCSQHFREEDIDRTSLSCVRLRPDVVPSVFPAFPPHLQGKQARKHKPPKDHVTPIIQPPVSMRATADVEKDQGTRTNYNVSTIVKLKLGEITSSANLPVHVAEWPAVDVDDSPQESILKQKLGQAKSSLASCRKKIKLLQQNERRLIKRLADLKTVPSELRKNDILSTESLVILHKSAGGVGDLIQRRNDKLLENLQTMSAAKECDSQSSQSDMSGPKARVVIQQCLSAKLLVKPATENTPDIFVQINRGVVMFVCFLQGSSSETVQKLVKTVLGVRLSETDGGRLVSVLDLPGDVLIVPQATLGGRLKGTTMQYHKNVDKAVGEQLYNDFVGAVQGIFDTHAATVEQGCSVHKGTYGNRQVLSVETNGPFTHVIEI